MKRSERQIKTPPFAIAPRGAATLTEQGEEGLRQAILTGFYQDGDFIPGYVAFARKIGVSTAVVRPAIARLIADGLCKPRPGLGLQVCSRAPATVGNVLVVTCGDASSSTSAAASPNGTSPSRAPSWCGATRRTTSQTSSPP